MRRPEIPLLRQGLDGHRRGQGEDQGLEKQSKTAALACPRDREQVDAADVATNPWDSGREVGFILKKIEMPPSLCNSVVNFLTLCPAFGTGEFRALLKVQVNIKSLSYRIKLYGFDKSRQRYA